MGGCESVCVFGKGGWGWILQTVVARTNQQALGQTWLSREMESLAKHVD